MNSRGTVDLAWKGQRRWAAIAITVVLGVPVMILTFNQPQIAPVAGRVTPQPEKVLAAAAAPTPTLTPAAPVLTPTPATTPAPAPVAATPRLAPARTPSQAVAAAPAPSGDIAGEAACPGQTSPAAVTTALACLASYARAQHGLGGVTLSNLLVAAADSKVGDMASCGYSHTACGHPADYWLGAHGFTGLCSAENIAKGQTTPREVFISWMNSPGHRANILNPKYTQIGVAVTGTLWAMELGGCLN